MPDSTVMCVRVFVIQHLSVIMRRHKRSTIHCSSSSKIFLFGFILGIAFFLLTRFAVVPCFWSLDRIIPVSDKSQREDASMTSTSTTDENLVLVGVMSAKQYLESRVIPGFDTWATTIPGKVRCLCVFDIKLIPLLLAHFEILSISRVWLSSMKARHQYTAFTLQTVNTPHLPLPVGFHQVASPKIWLLLLFGLCVFMYSCMRLSCHVKLLLFVNEFDFNCL